MNQKIKKKLNDDDDSVEVNDVGRGGCRRIMKSTEQSTKKNVYLCVCVCGIE